jgi:hypothetical protein
MLASNALPPCGHAVVGDQLHQQDAPRRRNTEAGLKRMRQRHLHFTHVDRINLHR